MPCLRSFIRLFICCAFLFSPMVVWPQARQVARYEREHKNSDPEYILVPMGERGITIFRDKDKYKDGKLLWEVICLDNELKERWNLEMDIESRLRLVGYDHKDDQVYILYRASEHEASNLILFSIHIHTQEIRRYEIKQELSFRITHFGILNRAVVMGGYVTNEPAVLIHDLETENSRLVPGFFISNTELLDLRMNTNNTFNTLIIDQKNKLQKKLIVKTFDVTGALLLDDEIEIEEKRTILTGITSTLLNDDLLIAGTWTVGSSRSAAGIYSVLVDPFNKQEIRYYDFGQLKHFFDYQSRQAKANGTVPDTRAHVSLMRLDEHPGGFALLNEIFQPSSNFNTSPYWNDFSNPYYYGAYTPYGYTPFMSRYYSRPYQYNNSSVSSSGENKILHSSLILFDQKGNLKYDYGLVIKDRKSNTIEQIADFVYNEGNVTMAYKKEREIFFMHTSDEEGEEAVNETLLAITDEPDEIIRSDTDNSFVRYWYDHFMYAWGYQRIRDNTKSGEDPTRNVFYVIKIRVD
jgi:hypothetical protein